METKINAYSVAGVEKILYNPSGIIEKYCMLVNRKIKWFREKDRRQDVVGIDDKCVLTTLLYEFTNMSKVEIGKLVNRSHASVINRINQTYNVFEIKQKYEQAIKALNLWQS